MARYRELQLPVLGLLRLTLTRRIAQRADKQHCVRRFMYDGSREWT